MSFIASWKKSGYVYRTVSQIQVKYTVKGFREVEEKSINSNWLSVMKGKEVLKPERNLRWNDCMKIKMMTWVAEIEE